MHRRARLECTWIYSGWAEAEEYDVTLAWDCNAVFGFEGDYAWLCWGKWDCMTFSELCSIGYNRSSDFHKICAEPDRDAGFQLSSSSYCSSV